jgi:ABC-2 type transport system permease protein
MKRFLHIFSTFLRTEIGVMLQYRGEIVLWSVWGLVNPLVLYAVFSAGARANPDQQMAGYTLGEIAAYFFVVMVTGHLTAAWDTHEMGWMVRTGRLSPLLLRPVLPMWKSLASNLAYKTCTLAFVGPMWVLFAWWIRPTFHTQSWQLVLGLLATALAFALNYLLCYVVALISFWTPRLDAVGELYFGLMMFLGGRFAPLPAIPEPVRTIAEWLPFQYMAYFPTELLTGRVRTPVEALAGLGAQAAWLVVVAVAFRLGWSAAVKRYTAVSG